MHKLKILFLPNWRVKRLIKDEPEIPSPNKILSPNSYWFFRYWRGFNFEVDVLDNYSPVPINILEKKIKFSILQSIRAFFLQNKYDIIISHGSTSSILFLFLNSVFRINHKPFLLIDIGCFNRARENKFELFLIKIAAKSIDFIIYHSSIQQKWYEKNLPFLSNKTKFIPFGVDEDEFKPQKLNRKAKFILSFGEPGRGRDYKTLLKSWENISHNDYKLIIIGPARCEELGYLNLPMDVELKGLFNIAELKEYIINSDFVVLPLPYYKHSYGQMSFLQSMSCGKAVVITKTPSTVDYFPKDYELFVAPKDPSDLARKIKYSMEHPAEIERIGIDFRKRIIDEFNEKKMANDIYSILKGIVDGRNN